MITFQNDRTILKSTSSWLTWPSSERLDTRLDVIGSQTDKSRCLITFMYTTHRYFVRKGMGIVPTWDYNAIILWLKVDITGARDCIVELPPSGVQGEGRVVSGWPSISCFYVMMSRNLDDTSALTLARNDHNETKKDVRKFSLKWDRIRNVSVFTQKRRIYEK